MKIRDKTNMEERLGIIKCECGYYNHKDKIQKYGTCKFCGKVLDKKAKYDYEMNKRLKLWRKDI